MKSLSVALALSIFIFVSSNDPEDESLPRSPIVQTKYGPVQGVERNGHFEFRGIPFAKPPVGNLRFKVPEEPDPWELINAIKYPVYCIQYNVFWNSTEGEEDCLYLTVFTPSLPSKENNSEQPKLPVMVYIHSGGFMFGRGSQFRGDYLMEHKNVVLVVFNYRLGSFGFLNTGDEHSIGNFGLKDQVQAFKFVQENIENFGGDKDRVMIFGTSAGSASVHYHIISPRSKGLFHTAFSGSGSAINPWAFQPHPISNAKKLARFHNCPTESTKELVECMKTKDAHEIGFSHSRFLDFYSDPIAAFGPSIESGNPDESSKFLTDTPIDLINKGEVNEVPWMIGFDADEGYEHTLGILKQPKLAKRLNSQWEQVFPITLEYVNEPPELQSNISKRVREFYFANQPISKDSPRNLSNAYSDKTFIHGIVEAARLHAKLGKTQHPIYLFNFAYEGRHSIVTLRGNPRDGFICNHMDDIQFLLSIELLFPKIHENSPDRPFQQKYLKMITSFAATGKVPPFHEESSEDLWEPLKSDGRIRYYYIKEFPKMEFISEELSKRVDFWNSFPLREYLVTRALRRDARQDEL